MKNFPAFIITILIPTTAYPGKITEIYLKDNAIENIFSTQLANEKADRTYTHIDGNLYEISEIGAIRPDAIKISSDKNYLMLYNSYIDMEQLNTCNKKISLTGHAKRFLADINKAKNLIVSRGQFTVIMSNCSIALVEKISSKEVIDIKAKPFYSQNKSAEQMFNNTFQSNISFSPDGNYIALSTINFSCRKGSYPGVYNTRTWKKVEFTTPDVDARCDALFPNLPTPSRVQQPICVDPKLSMR